LRSFFFAFFSLFLSFRKSPDPQAPPAYPPLLSNPKPILTFRLDVAAFDLSDKIDGINLCLLSVFYQRSPLTPPQSLFFFLKFGGLWSRRGRSPCFTPFPQLQFILLPLSPLLFSDCCKEFLHEVSLFSPPRPFPPIKGLLGFLLASVLLHLSLFFPAHVSVFQTPDVIFPSSP